MKISIQSGEDIINETTRGLVDKKLNNLSEKFDWVIGADVFFKKENVKGDKGFICEMRLSLPGPRIFASSDKDSFEAAVAETIDDLNVQLRKRKDKMKKH